MEVKGLYFQEPMLFISAQSRFISIHTKGNIFTFHMSLHNTCTCLIWKIVNLILSFLKKMNSRSHLRATE